MTIREELRTAGRNVSEIDDLVENLQSEVEALRAERDALKAENSHLWLLIRDGSLE